MATMYEDRKTRLPSADLKGSKDSADITCRGCSRYHLRPRSKVGILSHESERVQLRKKPLNRRSDRWSEVLSEVFKAHKIRDETKSEVAAIVDEYNRFKRKNIEIVETGCLAVGSSPEGQVVHMNLEAKDKDDPAGSLQTFFIELLLTNNDISTTFFRFVGTPETLPKKAETRGCVYCYGRGIHHPKVTGYRCGREHLYPILLDKIQKKLELAEGHKTHNILDEIVEQDEKALDALADRCARLALGQHSAEEGANFELVKTYGLGGAAYITPGFIMHINFLAKNKDPGASSVEAFFAEAIKISTGDILVTFCKSLGPTDSLSDEADLCGCEYCCDGMYHPPCSGYLIGR